MAPEQALTAPERERGAAGTGAPESADCRSFYRLLASGVSVLTSQGPDGPVGMTVSAVTSVSLRPPLLLACLAQDSRTLGAVRHSGAFAVHLLHEHQQQRSQLFASAGAERFAAVETVPVHGVPVMQDALGWGVCALERLHPSGDHTIVVGRIVAAHSSPGSPLLWHNSAYHALCGVPAQAG